MTLKLEVVQDHDPIDPRENDNLGTMICAHGRYRLGDEQIKSDNYSSWGDVEANLIPKKSTALPLYLYDHSGITMNTTGFHCSWDSGQVGYIYVSDELARTLLGWKSITKGRREKIKKYLKSEVEEYDRYLRGDAWGFRIVDEDGEVIESCYGYDDEDYCKQEGAACLKALQKSKVEA